MAVSMVNVNGQNYSLYDFEAQAGRDLTDEELDAYEQTGMLPASAVSAFNKNTSIENDTVSFSTAAAAAENTAAAETAQTAAAAQTSGSSREKTDLEKEIESKINELNAAKKSTMAAIEKIEKHIDELIEKAADKIEEAEKQQEKAVQEYNEESKKAVKAEMKKYAEANKNGKGMTKEELAQNIKNAVPDAPGLADAISAITQADGIADEIDGCVSELKPLIMDAQSIENELKVQQDALVNAQKAAEEAAAKASQQNCCDPIGFEYNGEKYDFIVDDGAFDSTSDFLGSSDNWAAMQTLDSNGDNTVDADELQAGGIKAVKQDGTVVDLSEVFGKDISVNLASYDENGEIAGIDTNDDDKDGAANQQLLGTFSLNIAGKEIKGYNTLDDTDWLSSKFGLFNGASGVCAAGGKKGLTLNEELQGHMDKADAYLETSKKIKEQAQLEYKNLGMTKDEMKELEEALAAEAQANVQNFFVTLTDELKEEEKKEKEDKEEKAEAAA